VVTECVNFVKNTIKMVRLWSKRGGKD